MLVCMFLSFYAGFFPQFHGDLRFLICVLCLVTFHDRQCLHDRPGCLIQLAFKSFLFRVDTANDRILLLKSLIIHKEKTKEITTVTVVWIPDLN